MLDRSIIDGLLLIEILVQHDRRLLNPFSLGESLIAGSGEEIVIPLSFGERGERVIGGLVIGCDVADDDNLVHRLDFFKVLFGNGGDGGKGLLDHVRHDPARSN